MGVVGTAARASIIPPHETVKTKNGVPVLFFKSPHVPIFEVRLVFGGGSDDDPNGESGAGAFAAAMTKHGIDGLDEEALSRKIDDLAAGVDAVVGEERTVFSAYGLTEHSNEILDLLFRRISSPSFPEKPFSRIRSNQIDNIVGLTDSPGGLAAHTLDLLLSNGTAKARPGGGLKRDIEKLKLEPVKAHYPNLVRTDRLQVLVIGGKGTEVVDRVVRGIEALPCVACGKPVSTPKPYTFPQWRVSHGHVLVLNRPGISEAHVDMGFVGPPRKIPEFYDLRVAETVLSGYFASRMNMVIREKLNLTYGIEAGFHFGDKTGAFSVTTSTRQEKVGELVTQVNKLLQELARDGVTDDELGMAKDYLVGSYPLGLQSLYAVGDAFFNGMLYGLEPQFMDVYTDRIQQVTKQSILAALKKWFHLNQLQTVIVGDAKVIGQRLEKAGIKYVVREPSVYL
jgi:zinc protease